MVPKRPWLELVILLAAGACGWLPADKPTTPPSRAPTQPTDPLIHTWLVEEHVMVNGASIEEGDAIGFHGRTVDISDHGYVSPWQGTCELADRTRHPRQLSTIVSELEVEPTDRARISAYGLPDDITEYRLSCSDRGRPPPLFLYIGGGRAMTCFGGACYLMKPFDG